MNAITLAIARLRKDQLEERLNLSQPRLWGECVAMAQVMTFLFTSGSLSLRVPPEVKLEAGAVGSVEIQTQVSMVILPVSPG